MEPIKHGGQVLEMVRLVSLVKMPNGTFFMTPSPMKFIEISTERDTRTDLRSVKMFMNMKLQNIILENYS